MAPVEVVVQLVARSGTIVPAWLKVTSGSYRDCAAVKSAKELPLAGSRLVTGLPISRDTVPVVAGPEPAAAPLGAVLPELDEGPLLPHPAAASASKAKPASTDWRVDRRIELAGMDPPSAFEVACRPLIRADTQVGYSIRSRHFCEKGHPSGRYRTDTPRIKIL